MTSALCASILTASAATAGADRALPRPSTIPPLHQPSARQPLTILEVGDSLGEDLEMGLTAELGANREVRLVARSVGDTGLANVRYYNWPAELEAELRQYHPEAVAVMLGANDLQSFMSGRTVVWPGTPQWAAAYAARVARMMREATSAGAHLLWVGLPIMGPSSGLSDVEVRLENSIFRQQARLHPGVNFAPTWRLFSTPTGQYSTYLPGPAGGLVEVRDVDEVHIDPGPGTERLASFIVRRMQRVWHIRL